MEDLKVLELFAGIGACSKALTNLGIPHTIVDAVEVDPYAVKSFNAVHGTNFESQDIKKWDKDIDVDLIMHGSPCQDFSSAGLQKGGDKDSGTRSSLMYETLRIVEKLKPKYVIWENVKNLLSKKHIHNFENYIRQMELLGYNSTYKVLNAKDYGVPQSRERVFTVSIRKDFPYDFHFPAPIPPVKLKDVLEPVVGEKYYLTSKQLASFQKDSDNQQAKGNGFKFAPRDPETYATCISTRAGSRKTDNFIPVLVKDGGRTVDREIDTSPALLARNYKGFNNYGMAGVLEYTNPDQIGAAVADGNQYRIRKLTPKECWRLMGFSDEDFGKAAKVNSDTQLYKQAGNSIVVDVLYNIFKELL